MSELFPPIHTHRLLHCYWQLLMQIKRMKCTPLLASKGDIFIEAFLETASLFAVGSTSIMLTARG